MPQPDPNPTPDERRRDAAAAVLARGVLRHLRAMKQAPPAATPESSSNCLEVSPEMPVHGGERAAG
jgi:hypothetical protein